MNRLFFALMNVMTEAKSERGAAGVEYGILIAAVAAVIVALAFTIGTEIQAAFQTIVNSLTA